MEDVINEIDTQNSTNGGEIIFSIDNLDNKDDAIATLLYLYPTGNGEELFESFIKNKYFLQDIIRIELKRCIQRFMNRIVSRCREYETLLISVSDIIIKNAIYTYILQIYDSCGLFNMEITTILRGNPMIFDSSPISEIVDNLRDFYE